MPKFLTSPDRLVYLACMAAVVMAGWLGWNNWALTDQLYTLNLKQQDMEQRLQIFQNLARQTEVRPTQATCPVMEAQVTASDSSNRPAPNGASSTQNSAISPSAGSEPTVQIPPGSDLREALQIIKREQAKNQAAVDMNPFGAGK